MTASFISSTRHLTLSTLLTTWSDPTYVDQWGFDGDLFFDDDGKVYFTSTFSEFVENGNFGNWITEIDITTGDSLSNSRLLHTTTVPPELGYPLLGRETFLCPVTWDDEGWPIFNNGNPITEYEADVLYDLDRPQVWRDEFDGGLVDKSYYYLRTPYKDFKDFESSPGKLRIRGNVYTLNDRETPAALLRKQVDLNTTFSTEVGAFSPENWRQEAGASIYLSIHYHNEIALTYSNATGKRAIVVHTRTGIDATLNTTYVEDEEVAAGAPVKLFIEAKDVGYRLGYSTGSNDPQWLASVENRWLQSYVEGWQNFVGSHFAIYSTGTRLPTLNSAEFEYIQTELN
ncbi:hypothetical protein K4K58_004793 [Colletotrichum sp. SAR11_239]|nr:hypothetical protein K4K58_004793 [Colletotrichum sp. SAR11_239]